MGGGMFGILWNHAVCPEVSEFVAASAFAIIRLQTTMAHSALDQAMQFNSALELRLQMVKHQLFTSNHNKMFEVLYFYSSNALDTHTF